MSRRKFAALEARIRKLEAPARDQARRRISHGLAEYERLRDALVPVGVYKDGLLRRIEYETRDALEAADSQSKKSALDRLASGERAK
jgi:hypothetical protein